MPAGRPFAPGGGTPSSSSSSATNANKRSAHDVYGDDGGRQGPGAGSSGKMKLPRLDRGAEDFSSVVKNRLQSYTRTGQACDRCKVRKIRCDALPEGCSHCVNLGQECFVTDRVTGRTERRGYMQELEREKNDMITRIRDLEKLLQEKGVEVKPFAGPDDPNSPSYDGTGAPTDRNNAPEEGWTQVRSVWVKHYNEDTPGVPYLIPNFPRSRLESRPDDANLGVGWDDRPLSFIHGTRLRVMGSTIDTASFKAPDMDEPPPNAHGEVPLYNKSVQAFWQSVMGRNPPVHVDLPSESDAFTYAEWYFIIMSTYIPVLHKPSFMSTLRRIYDEPDFQPTIPELVQAHMVFAIIYYQYGVRNWEDTERHSQLNDLSNKHYHFSLSKFFDLLTSSDLSAIQALTLIAAHTRAFPKPGCGTMVSNLAFQRAVELNFHRSPVLPPNGTNRDIELRKRTWWVLLAVNVAVTGRRGRPMPMTVEEFDVGLPEPLNDDALLEDGIDGSKANMPCEWEAGLATFKMIPIMMEMYSNIYSVRRDTQNYKKIIYALEKDLNTWERELPESLRMDNQGQEHNVAALYIKMYGQEIRLWLRHNSVNPTTDKKLMAENTRICEETARELLHTVQKIIDLKSLDTTWTQMTIYTMSLFSMLVAVWERRFETTMQQLAVLRGEMNDWLAVLKELSQLMGAGPEIQDGIRDIVATTIQWIEHDMQQHKTPQPAPMLPASSGSSPTIGRLKRESRTDQPLSQLPTADPSAHTVPPLPPSSATPTISQHPHSSASQPASRQHAHDGAQSNGSYYHEHGINGHTPYPALAYSDQHPSASISTQQYGPESGVYYSNQSQLPPANPAVASGGDAHSTSLMSFPPQPHQHVDPAAAEQIMWQRSAPGTNTWQDWTAAIADSQDRYGAGALMTLGSAATAAPAARTSMAGLAGGTPTATQDMASQWPLVMFDQHQPHQQHHNHHHHHHPHHQPQQQPPPPPPPHAHQAHVHHHAGP